MKDIFSEYHNYLKLERHYSPATVLSYEQDLVKLRLWALEKGNDIVKLDRTDLQSFISYYFAHSEQFQSRFLVKNAEDIHF